ncbi:MAG: M14 family zinc carboxypeptidase [Candidatus Promineifilaceae bacterium]
MATITDSDNPYVGPRTFTIMDRTKFYGRTHQARDLTALIVSNKLVLFYAPSGAGKSSLLNALISPMLVDADFEVLPTGRVSGYSGIDITTPNIYIYNLLLSLHKSKEIPSDFTTLTLSQFLDNLVQHDDGAHYYDPDYIYPSGTHFKSRLLIIDQFEELVTTNSSLWQQRVNFFEQLSEAMAVEEQLWVVLALREDFVARLDPYLHLTPNQLRHRYYMERLTREEAIEAIKMPVAAIRPFESEAIEQLANNLLRIRTTEEQNEAHFTQFVEPVQLQVVCYQMWEKLRTLPGSTITVEDVTQYADVDTALINFYEDTIDKTVSATGVSEVDLRNWFDRQLITEAGTRNMVFHGEETTGGLETTVADYLRQQFILVEVVRPGGTWYELVHERFVAPIVAANNAWRQEQPLIQLAQSWDKAGRPKERLLSGPQLEQLQPQDWQTLGPLVADYVAIAQQVQSFLQQQQQEQAIEQERQRTTKERRWRKLLTRAVGVSVAAIFIALFFLSTALQQSEQATEARATAETDATRANMAEATAAYQALVAMEARSTAESSQATAEARGTSLIDSLAAQESQLNIQLTSLSSAPTLVNGTVIPETTPIIATPDAAMQATAASINLQLNQVHATQTAVAQELILESTETLIIGYSVQGLPIEAVQIGSGANKLVFVGGIHSGTAPSTVALGQATVDYFMQHIEEIPQTMTLIIVPNLNPDSPRRLNDLEGRYNANGVDLNRNWNCNWTSDPIIRGERRENVGGTGPNSEPETQALAKLSTARATSCSHILGCSRFRYTCLSSWLHTGKAGNSRACLLVCRGLRI